MPMEKPSNCRKFNPFRRRCLPINLLPPSFGFACLRVLTALVKASSLNLFGSPRFLIDFGVYINADDIARALFEQKFTFETYELTPTGADFFDFATASGLVSEQFTLAELQASVSFEGPVVRLLNQKSLDRVAQLLARYLRGRTLTGTSPFFL